MPPKHATYIFWGEDQQADETRKFIEEAGVVLAIRDIAEKPLTVDEVDRLMKHMDPRHFINVLSDSYTKHGLDKHFPERRELLKLIAEDPTLLRKPIIFTPRLVTVGNDKESITQMLQLSSNGAGVDNGPSGNERHDRSNRRSGGRGGSRSGKSHRHASAAAK